MGRGCALPAFAVVLLAGAVAADPAPHLPNGYAWGCYNISKDLPFCNPRLGIDERIADLVGRLTVMEKVGLVSPDPTTKVSTCNFMDHGVTRLGVPPYMHLVEFNTVVASACVSEGRCATEFPGPTGLGATFNRSLWKAKGAVMSEEMRALNNYNWHRATRDSPRGLIGLTGYGPNINIMRDPRWGRNSEVPSEDPFLAGTYAENFVRGGQEGSDPRYRKVAMSLKHYTAYSVETNRGGFIPNITMHDLWETFLPQYRLGFHPQHGNATGAMCSYAGVNGVPSCANDYLLNKVMREKFANTYSVIGTDCGAVNNMIEHNHYAKDTVDASAKTLNGGTDMELGDTDWTPILSLGKGGLEEAMLLGKVKEETLDKTLHRVLRVRFMTGQFDPVEDQPYTKIPIDVVNATAHQQVNYEAALQSFVLLRNDGETLPFPETGTLAVVGPHINSTRNLFSDYAGGNMCFDNTYDCVPTIGGTFAALHGGKVLQAVGVGMDSMDASEMEAALEAVKAADRVVLCLGLGKEQEHEGMDRMNVTLPGLQVPFANKVLALGKPTVVVLVNGGAVSLDGLDRSPALIEAFYPGMRGAEALYAAITGRANRWGKMPMTVMPAADVYRLDFTSFDMSKGRSYKYYAGTAQAAFGSGLSYTRFTFNCTQQTGRLACTVRNVGGREGDEVLQAYHRAGDDVRRAAKHPVPLRELVGFERIGLEKGASGEVVFAADDEKLALVNQDGDREVYAGTHFIDVTDGNGAVQSFSYTVAKSYIYDTVPRP